MRKHLFHYCNLLSVRHKFTLFAYSVSVKHFNFCNLLFTHKLKLIKRVKASIKRSDEKLTVRKISRTYINVNVTGIVDGKMAAL